MFPVHVLNKWVHISCGSILVGALVLMMWGVIPALSGQTSEDEDGNLEGLVRKPLPAALVGQFKMLVHACLGILLLTGGYNFMTALPDTRNDMLYQSAFGLKFLLYIVVYVLAILALRGDAASTLPSARGRRILSALSLLGLVILLLSGYMNLSRIGLIRSQVHSVGVDRVLFAKPQL